MNRLFQRVGDHISSSVHCASGLRPHVDDFATIWQSKNILTQTMRIEIKDSDCDDACLLIFRTTDHSGHSGICGDVFHQGR